MRHGYRGKWWAILRYRWKARVINQRQEKLVGMLGFSKSDKLYHGYLQSDTSVRYIHIVSEVFLVNGHPCCVQMMAWISCTHVVAPRTDLGSCLVVRGCNQHSDASAHLKESRIYCNVANEGQCLANCRHVMVALSRLGEKAREGPPNNAAQTRLREALIRQTPILPDYVARVWNCREDDLDRERRQWHPLPVGEQKAVGRERHVAGFCWSCRRCDACVAGYWMGVLQPARS